MKTVRLCNVGVGVLMFTTVLGVQATMAQEGIVLTGVGPINRSMGGAATAAPIDASGALYWNPASITGLPSSEVEFGLEFLWPQTTLASSVPANALGAGAPPIAFAGSTNSDTGVFPLPTLGLVYRPEDSPWALGFGVLTVGGFGVNYPASTTNPFLQAPPLQGLGVGPLYTQLVMMQIVPTVAYQLSDRLSVGIAPTVTLASLSLDPDIVAPPDHPGGTPFVSYPRAGHSPIAAGGGVQAGVYYRQPDGWQLGASIKSPQWLEPFHFTSINAEGQPLDVPFTLDYPLIASTGIAYAGFPRWLLAADFRYIDYADTEGFKQGGFGPNGAVEGLGWRSIFAVATGVQYQCTDSLTARVGYSFNQSPVSSSLTPISPLATITAAAPAIIQHAVYAGASWRVNDSLILSLAYAHGFENSVSGVYRGPAVIVPGSNVTSSAAADTLIIGATVRFGPTSCR